MPWHPRLCISIVRFLFVSFLYLTTKLRIIPDKSKSFGNYFSNKLRFLHAGCWCLASDRHSAICSTPFRKTRRTSGVV